MLCVVTLSDKDNSCRITLCLCVFVYGFIADIERSTVKPATIWIRAIIADSVVWREERKIGCRMLAPKRYRIAMCVFGSVMILAK